MSSKVVDSNACDILTGIEMLEGQPCVYTGRRDEPCEYKRPPSPRNVQKPMEDINETIQL